MSDRINLPRLRERTMHSPLSWPQHALLALIDTAEAATETDDLLRRLSEWDMLYVGPGQAAATADAPYWQAEIAKARDRLRETLDRFDFEDALARFRGFGDVV